jgi:hypothetical protein
MSRRDSYSATFLDFLGHLNRRNAWTGKPKPRKEIDGSNLQEVNDDKEARQSVRRNF